ncbi:hypothetical protein [Streptomyces sp. NPDC050355]|uniref:hypothetical protein n=1 Tax=Streptomyces sp. NPDC050355 TaxID=3365609 RepID=UPI003799E871
MYTGRPEDLHRAEAKAAALAADVARLLTAIEGLGVGDVTVANGRLAGPSFEIRRINGRWTARA